MTQPWTVQCSYAAYYSNVVVVDADTLEQALAIAIDKANGSAAWKAIDHCGNTFVDAGAQGQDVDPWTEASCSQLDVPFARTEAALWTRSQPGYDAMRNALLAIAAGRAVARDGHTEIEDVDDPMSIAQAALHQAGIDVATSA